MVTWWFHGGYVAHGTRPLTGVSKGGGQVDSDQAALYRGGDKQLGLICGLEITRRRTGQRAGRQQCRGSAEVVTCHVTVISWLRAGRTHRFLSEIAKMTHTVS